MNYLNQEQRKWCVDQYEQELELLRYLGKIPAPSHHEEQRTAAVLEWFHKNGGSEAFIDRTGNVVLPVFVCEDGPVNVVMAHMDIVFPDESELLMKEDELRIYAPGIGDDTANLVNLMFASKYLLEHKSEIKNNVIIVANTCEEGLGNLKGSKEIVTSYGRSMRNMVSFDTNIGNVVGKAVGSQRYRITVRAQGGHSYGDFGNTNAIEQATKIIGVLYSKKVPDKAKTTYNIGVINGGTTINSICEECSMLYEYRSEDRQCMKEMKDFFDDVIISAKEQGIEVETELIGDRPCSGDVDHDRQAKLMCAMTEITRECSGEEPKTNDAMSTDCNSSLAVGIPSVCIGTVVGDGMHTRGEWIEKESMKTGLQIALGAVLYEAGILSDTK